MREKDSVILSYLYPRRCPVCGDIVMPKGELICPSCFTKLSYVTSPTCKKCGKEIISDLAEYCFDCTKHKRNYESGIALINYDDIAKKSMTQIKYKNKREYLDFYSEAICQRYQYQILRMSAQCLVPIPVHPARKRQRGFNQAEILANQLGKNLQIPVCSQMLIRNKKTAPQKNLDPRQRLQNLESAFHTNHILESVKSVILVDDIYTTGSTIEACTRVLKRAGIQSVYFISICIGQGR